MRLQCLFTAALASASPALSESAPAPDSDATEELARKGVHQFPFINTHGRTRGSTAAFIAPRPYTDRGNDR